MPTNYTTLVDGDDNDAGTFNAVLNELDGAIEDIKDGSAALSAPSISSFANATHDHTDAANGGQLTVSALDTTGAGDGDVLTADGAGGAAWQSIRVFPPGVFLPYGGDTAPAGYLLCDGSAVSRTTYADLFDVIGTKYGSGDGSTTFNLPDYRGRNFVGLDNMGGTSANRITSSWADSIGGAGGSETKTLTEANLPAHAHYTTNETWVNNNPGAASGPRKDTWPWEQQGFKELDDAPETSETGSGTAFDVMNPAMASNVIVTT